MLTWGAWAVQELNSVFFLEKIKHQAGDPELSESSILGLFWKKVSLKLESPSHLRTGYRVFPGIKYGTEMQSPGTLTVGASGEEGLQVVPPQGPPTLHAVLPPHLRSARGSMSEGCQRVRGSARAK